MRKIFAPASLPTEAELNRLLAIEREALPGERWEKPLWQAFLLQRACLLLIASKGFALFAQNAGEAELIKIAVSPQYQRQGWGSALMSQGVELLRQQGANKLFLEVRASNGQAKAWYEGLGFFQVGLRRDYYQQPREDALVYQKEL